MNITPYQAKALIKSQAGKPEVTRKPLDRQYNVPDELKQVAAYVFRELTAMKTGWRAAFKDERQVTDYKIQLLKGMDENGVDNFDLVNKGLKEARADANDFLPSVGKFINWCKPKQSGELNCAMYQEYRPERLLSSQTDQKRKETARLEMQKIRQMLRK